MTLNVSREGEERGKREIEGRESKREGPNYYKTNDSIKI